MGLRVRYFVAEPDGTVTRVARSRYQRWFSKDEVLPANRVGSELRFLEVVVEMDHHRVEDVLHILPFRHWVRGDGRLDAGAAMQLAVRAPEGPRRSLPMSAEKPQELSPFRQASLHDPAVAEHLGAEGEHLAWAEIEAAIELVHRAEDLGA